MNKNLSRSLLIIGYLIVAALGPSGCSDEMTTPGLMLTVNSAGQRGKLGGVAPTQTGRVFAVVNVTLKNLAGDPLPLAFLSFQLSVAGLDIAASPLTVMAERACPSGATLPAGNGHTCNVAFEMSPGDSVTGIHYRSADGRSVSEGLTVTKCTQCGPDCVDLNSDRNNCGGCALSVGVDQICVGGNAACTNSSITPCGDLCVDTATDSNHCGSCNTTVGLNQVCSGGKPACAPGYSTCGL